MLKIYYQFGTEEEYYHLKIVKTEGEGFEQLNNCELSRGDYLGSFISDMIIGAKAVKLNIPCLLLSPICNYIIKDGTIITFALNKKNRIPHSCTIDGEICGIVYQKDTLYCARNRDTNEYTLFDVISGEFYRGLTKEQYKSIVQNF